MARLHLWELCSHTGSLPLQQPGHAVGLAQAREHVCGTLLRLCQEPNRHTNISSDCLLEALLALQRCCLQDQALHIGPAFSKYHTSPGLAPGLLRSRLGHC